MHQTIAAVFDEYSHAQQALNDVVAAGVSRDHIHLNQKNSSSADTPTSQTAGSMDSSIVAGATVGSTRSAIDVRREGDESFGSGIRNFFAELFDDDDDETQLYLEAVQRGSYVMTVKVHDESQLDTISSVIERNHPIDINERASQWQSGGSAAGGGTRSDSIESRSTSDSAQGSTGSLQRSTSDAEHRIPVIEEQLTVGKRVVQRGSVRIFQRVVENPVHESVQLREEHVHVERHPVNNPATGADLAAFKETSFELRETAEEAVVQKSVHIVEEVIVGTETTQRTEQIKDTVRRTEVEVENLTGQASGTRSMQDEERYRSHYNSMYAKSGQQYDVYAPAYTYGSSLKSDKRYQGRAWEDVEPNARTYWESRNPASLWKHFKDAVQHGWENVTDQGLERTDVLIDTSVKR